MGNSHTASVGLSNDAAVNQIQVVLFMLLLLIFSIYKSQLLQTLSYLYKEIV